GPGRPGAAAGGGRPRLLAATDAAPRAGGRRGMRDRGGNRDADRTGSAVVRAVDREGRPDRGNAQRRVPRAGGTHGAGGRTLMLRFLTAGESHGPELVVIVEGLPAGVVVDGDAIDHQLVRRQQGYGRGARSTKIERDHAEVVSGVSGGTTTGAPVAMRI